MSFLDMDERLLELSGQFDLVYSPLVDFKVYPESVDVALVEGAISSVEDEHKIHHIRKAHQISHRDGRLRGHRQCAGHAQSLWAGADSRARLSMKTSRPSRRFPACIVPALLDRVRPVHEFVKVDMYLPGCPPSADTFYTVLSELLAGRTPDVASLTRFGA